MESQPQAVVCAAQAWSLQHTMEALSDPPFGVGPLLDCQFRRGNSAGGPPQSINYLGPPKLLWDELNVMKQDDPDKLRRRRQQQLVRRRKTALALVRRRFESELDVIAGLLDRKSVLARPTLFSGSVLPFRHLRSLSRLKP